MKLKSISSGFVPASAILLQFFLWSSPVVRATEVSPVQESREYALIADDADLFPETEEGGLRACNPNNRVYIQYCKDPRDGAGTCKLRAGCPRNDAAFDECERDFKAVCGYVPKDWYLE